MRGCFLYIVDKSFKESENICTLVLQYLTVMIMIEEFENTCFFLTNHKSKISFCAFFKVCIMGHN